MSNYYHSVRLNGAQCTGCINCIKRCPTEAIRVRKGKSVINPVICIDCGECIRVCPKHARYASFDKLSQIEDYEYTIALPDPALYVQFNGLVDPDILIQALKDLGFDDVFEVALAAEILAVEARRYIEEHPEKRPAISSFCPTVVRLIKIQFPNLIGNLLPLKPPSELAAEIAVKKAMERTGLPREKIGVFHLAPCPSKVTYSHSPLGVEKSEIDKVLSIGMLYPQLVMSLNSAAEKDCPKISNLGKTGISAGKNGGQARGIISSNYLSADGMENIIKVLEDLEDQKFERVRYCELNCCPGGCVGGILNVENPYIAATKIQEQRRKMPIFVSHPEEAAYVDDYFWTSEIKYEPALQLSESLAESFARMNMTERLIKKLPGLDCASCGAPSCRAHAEDVARGKSNLNDCVHIVNKDLMDLSDKIGMAADTLKKSKDPALSSDNGSTYRFVRELSDEMKRIVDRNRNIHGNEG